MKNTFKYIMAVMAFFAAGLAFSQNASAQDDGSTVKYDKTVSGPDANGVYTISLEAYVTGSVTLSSSTAPADIILVLDRSGSMAYNLDGTQTSGVVAQNQRINILKSAVKSFVDIVKESNASIEEKDKDAYGGHRIAIVWFSGNSANGNDAVYTGITGLNTFQNVENLTTTAASGTGNNYSAAQVRYNNNNLLNVTAYGGTITDAAMNRAKTILSGQVYSDKPNRSRVVVFFTDGEPGLYGWTNSQWGSKDYYNFSTANNCISAANDIKNDYSATVYSVGLFGQQTNATATTTYLAYTSSDFKDKTRMPSTSSDWVNVSGNKSIIVSSAGALSSVFSSIATSAGGDYSASSASSVLVDIVASNFTIPDGTDLGTVKVYKDTCTQASKDAIITFAQKGSGIKGAYVDITDEVGLTTDKTTGEVIVTGFDYGANWCGWDESANNKTGGPHGNKLVLEIPITVNADAVGGPAVETNAEGSKLIIKDSEGKVISENSFISPTLKIPVQIWIQKQGLVGEDSAVFTLRRTKFEGSDVDYTATSIKWDTFTKVVVNKENMDSNGLVKISGLDPDYVYKLEEDAWAFGYTYQYQGTNYTVGDNVKNPFVIINTPNDTKKAEAVARNVFKEKTN